MKINLTDEEAVVLLKLCSAVYKEVSFGAGVDVWLAGGGACDPLHDDPLITPEDAAVDVLDDLCIKLHLALHKNFWGYPTKDDIINVN